MCCSGRWLRSGCCARSPSNRPSRCSRSVRTSWRKVSPATPNLTPAPPWDRTAQCPRLRWTATPCTPSPFPHMTGRNRKAPSPLHGPRIFPARGFLVSARCCSTRLSAMSVCAAAWQPRCRWRATSLSATGSTRRLSSAYSVRTSTCRQALQSHSFPMCSPTSARILCGATTGGSRWASCCCRSTGSTPCCGWPTCCCAGTSSWPATSESTATWRSPPAQTIRRHCWTAAVPAPWSRPVRWPSARRA